MRFREEQQHRMGQRVQHDSRWVPISRISPNLIRAILASEDLDFFKHHGFDWGSIWDALLLNIQHKRIIKGGSGITQQLAKNIFLDPSRTLTRSNRSDPFELRGPRRLSFPG